MGAASARTARVRSRLTRMRRPSRLSVLSVASFMTAETLGSGFPRGRGHWPRLPGLGIGFEFRERGTFAHFERVARIDHDGIFVRAGFGLLIHPRQRLGMRPMSKTARMPRNHPGL